MHPGNGSGLSQRRLGERDGAETATLSGSVPAHTHQLMGSENEGTTANPGNALLAGTEENTYDSKGNPVPMGGAVAAIGGQPHNNIQPFLTLNFLIALEGVFPSRN